MLHIFFDKKYIKKIYYLKMVKSLNKFGATVKTFLDAGYSKSWIAR